jgi:citrate synthase
MPHSKADILVNPDVNRYFTENFLYMLRAYPGGRMKYLGDGRNDEIKQVEIDALDAILTLHADHEQNASTTTVRNVGSTSLRLSPISQID